MKLKYTIIAVLALTLFSCKDKEEPQKQNTDKTQVLENYANIVFASYSDVYQDVVAMKTAIDTFVADPTALSQQKAKDAWLAARETYGQTETFRFSNGPIDDADGPEGLLNAWPLDENYVDYVSTDPNSGIINDVTNFPIINSTKLEKLNEKGDAKNISVGFHAIEFLLWGQDLTDPSEKKAGLRSYTDFTTAKNANRRGQYLKVCAAQIVDLMAGLKDEWDPAKSKNYRATFLAADPDQNLTNILQALGIFAKSELGGERVLVALSNKDQEDEHSCFSDNTHRDIYLNIKGVQNVFTGKYKSKYGAYISGKSISDLILVVDVTTQANAITKIQKAVVAAENIPNPFDLAISDPIQKTLVNTTYLELQDVGDALVVVASKLGLTISTALPE